MNEDQLKEALAENGAYDGAKAKGLKREATKTLDLAMKKVLWHSFAYLILWIVVGLFAFQMLREATETKTMVGFGILLLVAYESTVLIKLWYWIVNSKLSMLKELKRMRLELAALTQSSGVRPDPSALGEALPFQSTMGWKARWIYVIALVVIVFFVNGPLWTFARRAARTLTSQVYVTLEADGPGLIITELTYRHLGAMPLEQLDFYSGSPAEIRWIERTGGELEVRSEESDGQYRHTARLPAPVMPGDDLNYLMLMPAGATREDGVWVFEMDWSYGHQVNRYEETVKLPPRAEVVSVDPEPAARFIIGDAPVLRFEAERRGPEKFAYRITYRLTAVGKQ